MSRAGWRLDGSKACPSKWAPRPPKFGGHPPYGALGAIRTADFLTIAVGSVSSRGPGGPGAFALRFGGEENGQPWATTFSYAGGVWTNLTGSLSTTPRARSYEGLSFDTADGYAFMFGGTTTPPNYSYWNDSWSFQ